ncbi:Hypothetical predicted protein [Pelobates cultripes]|uniref:Uncharacterized protein n=1 Tax=Pelobates cultripes TaxID=61616 RepID=A0AAD1SZU7_PELCU|nr:Hypothetical predicted protein [Pelobates cultripes]
MANRKPPEKHLKKYKKITKEQDQKKDDNIGTSLFYTSTYRTTINNIEDSSLQDDDESIIESINIGESQINSPAIQRHGTVTPKHLEIALSQLLEQLKAEIQTNSKGIKGDIIELSSRVEKMEEKNRLISPNK